MKNKSPKYLLDQLGLKKTAVRIAILEILLRSPEPLTSPEILKKLGPTAPNKTTIYRNLRILTDSGMVHRVFLERKTAAFELSFNCSLIHCHPHFMCKKCKKTFCIKDLLPKNTVKLPGFKVDRQKILLEGTCKQCSKF